MENRTSNTHTAAAILDAATKCLATGAICVALLHIAAKLAGWQ